MFTIPVHAIVMILLSFIFPTETIAGGTGASMAPPFQVILDIVTYLSLLLAIFYTIAAVHTSAADKITLENSRTLMYNK